MFSLVKFNYKVGYLYINTKRRAKTILCMDSLTMSC